MHGTSPQNTSSRNDQMRTRMQTATGRYPRYTYLLFLPREISIGLVLLFRVALRRRRCRFLHFIKILRQPFQAILVRAYLTENTDKIQPHRERLTLSDIEDASLANRLSRLENQFQANLGRGHRTRSPWNQPCLWYTGSPQTIDHINSDRSQRLVA